MLFFPDCSFCVGSCRCQHPGDKPRKPGLGPGAPDCGSRRAPELQARRPALHPLRGRGMVSGASLLNPFLSCQIGLWPVSCMLGMAVTVEATHQPTAPQNSVY